MTLRDLVFQTIVSDMTPPPPHVVNIDVNSGAVTVESPQETDFLSNVSVPVRTVCFFKLWDFFIIINLFVVFMNCYVDRIICQVQL